ncbi:MAG: hypothetical protein QOJ59_1493 [Thermomicrobiales bacterium]|jgi:hypothetical protein|nr:hypothetical protein [Thermomicrobiales bacterium]
MNVGHSVIGFDVANLRREEFLREAAAQRLVVEAQHGQPAAVGVLRRQIGNILVRFGEHLQGARRQRVAEDLGNTAGALRLAR